jgi:hypothetical protein
MLSLSEPQYIVARTVNKGITSKLKKIKLKFTRFERKKDWQ